jgi:RNA-directed DNA polymerase
VAFFNLKKRAAPGADGLTWADYAADLDRNLTNLHARVHSGAYRALPSRRKYIPKADGKQRPLGIAALEDKIVQAAVVAILTPIYEAEFLGFSYGSDLGAASTMRWMRSHTESTHAKSTGFLTPTYRGSSIL